MAGWPMNSGVFDLIRHAFRLIWASLLGALILTTAVGALLIFLGAVTRNPQWIEWGQLISIPAVVVAAIPLILMALLVITRILNAIGLRRGGNTVVYGIPEKQIQGVEAKNYRSAIQSSDGADIPAAFAPPEKPPAAKNKPAAQIPQTLDLSASAPSTTVDVDAWITGDDPSTHQIKTELAWTKIGEGSYKFSAPKSREKWDFIRKFQPICLALLKSPKKIKKLVLDAQDVSEQLFGDLSSFISNLFKNVGEGLIGRFRVLLPTAKKGEMIVSIAEKIEIECHVKKEDFARRRGILCDVIDMAA
jgi:hypothetical protein